MSITEFLDKLSTAHRRWADAVIQLLSVGMLLLLAWYGTGLVNASWGNILTVLGWAMAWQYLALPVGAAAMLVFVGWDFVQTVRGVPRETRYGA